MVKVKAAAGSNQARAGVSIRLKGAKEAEASLEEEPQAKEAYQAWAVKEAKTIT
jgi:hypothetical protein